MGHDGSNCVKKWRNIRFSNLTVQLKLLEQKEEITHKDGKNNQTQDWNQ